MGLTITRTFDPADPAAAGRVIVLDGGMGQELIARAHHESCNWSAEALVSAPDLVREVHRDFFAAGAEIATTNSYAVNWRRFADATERTRLNALSGRLAAEARDAHGTGLVAGCLPPYGGSYVPSAVKPLDELIPLYREQIAALEPYADFYLCETMSTAKEALAAATAAAETGKPVWVAWTLMDDDSGFLRSGESLETAVAAVAHLPISAFLVNCSAPESIGRVIPFLARHGACGGYGNGFRQITENWALSGKSTEVLGRRQDLDPKAYLEIAKGWRAAGATLIGGCCEIGPRHIAKLADELQ